MTNPPESEMPEEYFVLDKAVIGMGFFDVGECIPWVYLGINEKGRVRLRSVHSDHEATETIEYAQRWLQRNPKRDTIPSPAKALDASETVEVEAIPSSVLRKVAAALESVMDVGMYEHELAGPTEKRQIREAEKSVCDAFELLQPYLADHE